MKDVLLTYKPFLRFLAIFFGVYAILALGYNLYLSQYKQDLYPIDPFTTFVSHNVQSLSELLGTTVEVKQYMHEPWTRLEYNQKNIARVIEGCNAASIMILFVAFVAAFARQLKPTVFFIIFGLISIHIINVLRIYLLTLLMYYYPQHTHLLHGVLFPLIIYGYIFILWIIWIRKVFKN